MTEIFEYEIVLHVIENSSLIYINSLLCKSVDWSLYDRGLRHERVKRGNFAQNRASYE